ncbi:BlaI/MecI/CopY family transcriptional regulator [Shewanella sp. GXUN23E]|uniref:BlaI/MecI/CopY family transcriptional regulator n=1 Tax=Shewanella sp. GXUN23E TaxID=3422498 RepID=UPI003D7EF401
MNEISNAELVVLNLLWQRGTLTSTQAVEALQQTDAGKDWHEKTIKTLLSRLVKKQAIGFEKQGRGYCYFPLMEQERYQRQACQSFIDRLFSGRLAPLVAGFAKDHTLTAEDAAELQKLLDDWKDNNS